MNRTALKREFGKELTLYRETNQLSQDALAVRLGVTGATVSSWERAITYPCTVNMHRVTDLMPKLNKARFWEVVIVNEVAATGPTTPNPSNGGKAKKGKANRMVGKKKKTSSFRYTPDLYKKRLHNNDFKNRTGARRVLTKYYQKGDATLWSEKVYRDLFLEVDLWAHNQRTKSSTSGRPPQEDGPEIAYGSTIHGWPLTHIKGEEEPRVMDLVLAERLGYERPRKIRELIRRHITELRRYGSLEPRPTAVRGKNQHGETGQEETVYVFYLNEAQALLISILANTEAAADTREALIKLYEAYRKGSIPGHGAARVLDVEVRDAIRSLPRVAGILKEIQQQIKDLEQQVRGLLPAPAANPAAPHQPTAQWTPAGVVGYWHNVSLRKQAVVEAVFVEQLGGNSDVKGYMDTMSLCVPTDEVLEDLMSLVGICPDKVTVEEVNSFSGGVLATTYVLYPDPVADTASWGKATEAVKLWGAFGGVALVEGPDGTLRFDETEARARFTKRYGARDAARKLDHARALARSLGMEY